MNDERILKKVDKLLKLYGVVDEEREKFLLDLKDKKYDDQEEVEETVEEKEELPTENGEVEEQPAEEEVGEENANEDEVAEKGEEVVEEETPTDDVEQPLPEQPEVEQPPMEEQPTEENPMEQPMEQVVEQPQQPNEDVAKTIEGLMARIESLEDIVKKLGTPVEDENIGVAPQNPSGESFEESEFDRINRLRRGR